MTGDDGDDDGGGGHMMMITTHSRKGMLKIWTNEHR